MKTHEIRLGNLVMSRINGVSVIEQIGSPLSSEYVAGRSLGGNYWENSYLPIPLTKQWLIDFGFEEVNKNDRYFLLRKELGSTINNKGKEVPLKFDLRQIDSNQYLLNNIFSKTIRLSHVHTLQNLYFVLTGEELTLKQTK